MKLFHHRSRPQAPSNHEKEENEMTAMNAQAVQARPAKRRTAGYVLLDVAVFVAYYVFAVWSTYAIAPFFPGWEEPAAQILIRLPVSLIAYKLLKRSSPAGKAGPVDKKSFRRFAWFYVLAIQLPIKLASPIFAAAAPLAEPDIGAIALNAYFVAPFVEEVIFRGLFFNLSRRHLDFRTSAILNACLFSFIHLGMPFTMLITFLLALLFCTLYEMTGSLKPTMLLHFVFNILTLPATVVMALVPPFFFIPLMIVALVLHVMLWTKRDKLQARLHA